jgi:predicted heme/steroid binding protein
VALGGDVYDVLMATFLAILTLLPRPTAASKTDRKLVGISLRERRSRSNRRLYRTGRMRERTDPELEGRLGIHKGRIERAYVTVDGIVRTLSESHFFFRAAHHFSRKLGDLWQELMRRFPR